MGNKTIFRTTMPKPSFDQEKNQEQIQQLNTMAFELEMKRMLYLQLRDATNYEEWRNSPIPLTYDEDVTHSPKTVEDCLKVIFLYIKEDQNHLGRNEDFLQELEDMLFKDHEKVLKHEKQIDRNFAIIVRLKLLLTKLKSEKKTRSTDIASLNSRLEKLEIGKDEQGMHPLQELSNMAGAPAMGFNPAAGQFEYCFPDGKENTTKT